MKFTFPMAFSMTMLSWGLIQYWETYEAIGELDYAVETVKWGADWLLKANPRKDVLFACVGDPKVNIIIFKFLNKFLLYMFKFKKDHSYWGRAENFTDWRPTAKVTTSSPGSDVAAEVSAAMSAASLIRV